jgi:hypothetical protein
MSQEAKRTSLLFLFGALISLVLLSGGLSNLKLHPGTPFPGVDSYYTDGPAAATQIQAYSFTALPGLFGLILLLLTIYVLIRLVALVNLKWLLPWIFKFILALTALFVFLIILSYLNFWSAGAPEWMLEIAPSPSTGISTSLLGRPPSALIWFVIIGFTLAIGLLIIKVFTNQMQLSKLEDPLVQQAKNAMKALQAGGDFRNVIVDCYLQMTNVLQEECGIERSHQMTAREFQDWLEFKGLPRIPMQNLTNLFEKVRYGKQHFDQSDEKIALDSLSEVIQFAERTKDEALAK